MTVLLDHKNNAKNLYKGIRYNVAHNYLTTFNLILHNEGNKEIHLSKNKSDCLHLDTTCFYEDFLQSYPFVEKAIRELENLDKYLNILERDFVNK
jgi:hypothetical protein